MKIAARASSSMPKMTLDKRRASKKMITPPNTAYVTAPSEGD